MKRPTDDELEAQAVEFSQAAELSCFLSNDEYRRTAALLRACMGQPAPDHAEWNAALEAAVEIATDWTLGPEEVAPAIRSLKKGQTDD